MRVIVVGRSPEKMDAAIAVLESHGLAAIGVFSEQEALRAVAEQDELLAVVAGGSIDEPAQERLRAAAAPKGAVLITAYIGHDDPTGHFTNHVIPKLADARDHAHQHTGERLPSRGSRPGSDNP
jgi:CBS-domain-containing membrane protein